MVSAVYSFNMDSRMRDVIDQHAPTETHGELQHTLAHSVEVCGQGLMSSEEVRLVMHPAPVGHGIMYERADLNPSVQVPALERYVRKRTRRTAIAIGDIYIDTIEHCQSALAGLRVDNVLLELHGAELPCGDGSAGLFVDAINGAGLVAQDAPRTVHRITEPIMVQEGDAMLAAFPTEEDTFQAFYDLDYGVHSHRIQRQAFNFTTLNGNYHTELAPARTFSLK